MLERLRTATRNDRRAGPRPESLLCIDAGAPSRRHAPATLPIILACPGSIEPRLAAKHPALEALCSEHGVATLDLFGSAAGPGFDPQRSDYDFIVRFAPRGEVSLGRRYVAFTQALEALLGRPVDVMTDHPVENPYLRRAIEATRQRLYVDAAAEASV